MRLSHTRPVVVARFDEPNLVSAAGLGPVMGLAQAAGLDVLAGQLLTVPTDKGANPGGKVSALVAGMVAGADSIDDTALLRHGAMRRLFDRPYAPSTLGSFLRAFRFGHVRQLDAVASRLLVGLAERTAVVAEIDRGLVYVDVDDMVIEVHGYAKQGAEFGYTRVRGLNALLATVTTGQAAPVVVAQRLRKRPGNAALSWSTPPTLSGVSRQVKPPCNASSGVRHTITITITILHHHHPREIFPYIFKAALAGRSCRLGLGAPCRFAPGAPARPARMSGGHEEARRPWWCGGGRAVMRMALGGSGDSTAVGLVAGRTFPPGADRPDVPAAVKGASRRFAMACDHP